MKHNDWRLSTKKVDFLNGYVFDDAIKDTWTWTSTVHDKSYLVWSSASLTYSNTIYGDYSNYTRCVRDDDTVLEWSKRSIRKYSYEDAYKYAEELNAETYYTENSVQHEKQLEIDNLAMVNKNMTDYLINILNCSPEEVNNIASCDYKIKPKKMIKIAQYAYFNGQYWFNNVRYFKNDADFLAMISTSKEFKRLLDTEIEVEDY